ncbi:MAG: tryptophan--tRNA ligase [Candidatus Liptonbacteria bacterium]
MKPILVSGIQPSGRLHLGNYLGALKNFVELQNSGKYQCYFFIADLHSLTENYTPEEKRQQILELAADFIAAGLDPKKSIIFLQSQVPAHNELAWILNTITPLGELYRMTQFKDKSSKDSANPEHRISNTGLLVYPVLMAADIILYDTKFVPVGEDQIQHLELTRTLVRKFNSKFGNVFVEPQPILTHTPRIMSLKNPMKKMSKSDPQSCVFLDDSPEDIRAKFKTATTDSGGEIKYEPNTKPGISNMLKIFSAVSGQHVKECEKMFAGSTYSNFKSAVAESIVAHFADFREKKQALLARPKTLATILNSGSKKASLRANRKIKEVKNRVGLTV